MPVVTLDLIDDGIVTSRSAETLPTRAEAAARAHDLSNRMTVMGVQHRISCHGEDRKPIPFRDAKGVLIGAPESDPESAEAYIADVEAQYEAYHRRMKDHDQS